MGERIVGCFPLWGILTGSRFTLHPIEIVEFTHELDDGWPESEKDVFQAALRMVVVKDSR